MTYARKHKMEAIFIEWIQQCFKQNAENPKLFIYNSLKHLYDDSMKEENHNNEINALNARISALEEQVTASNTRPVNLVKKFELQEHSNEELETSKDSKPKSEETKKKRKYLKTFHESSDDSTSEESSTGSEEFTILSQITDESIISISGSSNDEFSDL